jgi:hypothetical protein
MKFFPIVLSVLLFSSKCTSSSNSENESDQQPNRRRRVGIFGSLNIFPIPVVPTQETTLVAAESAPVESNGSQVRSSQDSWAGFPFAQPDPSQSQQEDEPIAFRQPDSVEVSSSIFEESTEETLIQSQDSTSGDFDLCDITIEPNSSVLFRTTRICRHTVTTFQFQRPVISVINFDANDSDMYPLVLEASSETVPRGSSCVGKFVDRENNTRYVNMPFRFQLSAENDSESEEEDMLVVGDGETNRPSTPTIGTENAAQEIQATPPPNQSNVDIFKTPTNQRIPVANFPPLHRLPSFEDAQREDESFYDNFVASILPECKCDYAVRRLEIAMASIAEPAVVHTEFRYHNQVFGQHDIYFVYHQNEFTSEQLRAFEVNFRVFFRMVSRCPKRFFYPSLALALQYDQDFHKFLQLYFKIPHKIHSDALFHSLNHILMHLPVVSSKALHFFTSCVNAAFFFKTSSPSSHFIGKFPEARFIQNLVSFYENAQKLDSSQVPEVDYSMNPLRRWFLEFNYLTYITSRINEQSFAENHLYSVLPSKAVFKSALDYYLAIYSIIQKIGVDVAFLTKKLHSSSIISHREKRDPYDATYLRMLTVYKIPRELLKLALQMRDVAMVQSLFKLYILELNDLVVDIRSLNSHPCVLLVPFQEYCVVKILEFGILKASLILPYGSQADFN